jgi:hypothetical protein
MTPRAVTGFLMLIAGNACAIFLGRGFFDPSEISNDVLTVGVLATVLLNIGGSLSLLTKRASS